MVKFNVGKFNGDRKVQKNRFSNVVNGKVEKSKNKFGHASANSDLVVHGKSKLGNNNSDLDGKPFKKGKRKRNAKQFKNEFESSDEALTNKSDASKAVKRKFNEESEKNTATKSKMEERPPKKIRFSNDRIPKKHKWINRQRVLVFACRGISTRDRHLMKDLRKLMPHSRPENKLERRENLSVVNEICAMKNCNKCMLLEGRANRDVYMWLSDIPNGPSVKFLLQNIYTMDELKFTGNCLIGSRPLLSFDKNFEAPHFRLMKELITQIFGTPNCHPKSQPFFDHVFTFSVVDDRIWFRNYQILSEKGAVVEIGPRFIMNPVKIFESSFGGETIWENPSYVTPAKNRQLARKAVSGKYVHKRQQKEDYKSKQGQLSYKLPDTDEVFTATPFKTAKELVARNNQVQASPKVKNKNRKPRKKHRK